MSFRSCGLKNISGGSLVLRGRTYAVNEVKQIEDAKRFLYADDDDVINAISGGTPTFQITDMTNVIAGSAAQIKWLQDYRTIVPLDDSGRQVIRYAATESGWKFLSHVLEIDTSTAGGVYAKDFKGDDRTTVSLVHLNAAGAVITTDLTTDCVETRITIKPGYDYDVLKGTIYNHAAATADCRVYLAIGAFTGAKEDIDTFMGQDLYTEFLGGINLKKFAGNHAVDGESSKMVLKDIGIGKDVNMAQIRVRHGAGLVHCFMVSLEYYRA